ncbi:MAG: hypothetical protein PHI97_35210 [Desulfobulbus sp.]|nr:hypothetical protein [Desulfobulbus sp.]
MWKLTLCCNVLLLFICWILSLITITPAHNLLVVYSETVVELPILTDLAIRYRPLTVCVPLVWAILTILLVRRLVNCPEAKRNGWIALHLSCSLVLGLGMFTVFILAGILPVLKIGASLG